MVPAESVNCSRGRLEGSLHDEESREADEYLSRW